MLLPSQSRNKHCWVIILRKFSKGFRADFGCDLSAAVRLIVNTGKRQGFSAFESILITLNPLKSLFSMCWAITIKPTYLLIIYLQEHRVSIWIAVKVSIISVFREIIVRGVLETPWVQILAAIGFRQLLKASILKLALFKPTTLTKNHQRIN